jgi:hypothetical protein
MIVPLIFQVFCNSMSGIQEMLEACQKKIQTWYQTGSSA